VDLDALLQVVADLGPVVQTQAVVETGPVPGDSVRIGIARDAAFGFYYPDDLECLRGAGAELVQLDLIRDERLPTVDGLFIGGGFPETSMRELEANASMRQAVRDFIEEGNPVYAECGGLMYLARSLTWRGKTCKMVGAIQGDAVMYDRPQGRGYARLQETAAAPWPRRTGSDPLDEIAAHEFHYSRLENISPQTVYAYRVLRGTGVDGRHDGIVYKALLASYVHMRGVGGNEWPRRFIDYVKAVKAARLR
jgi:cobyrinic acid a,c-diamide synthase